MQLIIPTFIIHWYLSLFSQTFFLHRYSAHKMFTMNKFWERFFYALTYVSQGSSYLSPKAYAILHRMHHAFSDTPRDPHSPHHTKNVFTMMWKTKDIYNAILFGKSKIEPQFDKNYPYWQTMENIGDSWISRAGWGTAYSLLYIGAFIWLDMHWAFFLLLPIHFLMGPIHGAIVNWSGHKYGYQNYDNNDKSKNSLVLDFLMMGELFQNNHHKLPNQVNFASKWYEFDPTYPIIKALHWMHIIRLKPVKAKPSRQLEEA
ncbi:acyl-CoA desaturase [Siphonobacter aquaeclarae]|jgi:stearoyl-CoA desaturase (delta-9 desaturase)|uniref:Stearoyl-CoA desaturase (Delta-9 desaturase) n=1 Tax=Siphonobacter aquaeclarae TaxID=563176 RepID=A0A1G9RWR3_9BACT|nr:acyl-CoA desaturase [Siphonobacter aquaeclarae]MBO9638189.1 acyl-CoA desaturase [Siphonobacter aquaeclarae]SDM27460.1 stearoyl-CoA desaturase (delta-9 desaturase) [Siphonobacter aquaeclarae]